MRLRLFKTSRQGILGLLFALFIFCGCASRLIDLRTDYLRYDNLASYRVRTPDPRLKCPLVGQRLIATWNLDPALLNRGELVLNIRIRFRTKEEVEKRVCIHKIRGSFIYTLADEEYFAKRGIQTYKAELIQGETVIEEWRHQLWAELITFEDPQEKCETHYPIL
jgi:hypothetical protein